GRPVSVSAFAEPIQSRVSLVLPRVVVSQLGVCDRVVARFLEHVCDAGGQARHSPGHQSTIRSGKVSAASLGGACSCSSRSNSEQSSFRSTATLVTKHTTGMPLSVCPSQMRAGTHPVGVCS